MPSSRLIEDFCLALKRAAFLTICFAGLANIASAQEPLPWERQTPNGGQKYERGVESFAAPRQRTAESQIPPEYEGYGSGSTYNNGPEVRSREPIPGRDSYGTRRPPEDNRYGDPYDLPRDKARRAPRGGDRYDNGYERYDEGTRSDGAPYDDTQPYDNGYYSQGEISRAGHKFFGSVSSGLASVIEYAFKKSGRPNGYILGEDAGGAVFAGLRYGEGMLHTRQFGSRKVYWQGPSVGYDFGAAGSKTMILVYNLRDPSQIFHRFGGVEGSAYLVGGVSIQFQKYGNVVLAPIRSGVGLRLGANVGYLKYTRRPTWNPF
mgnify:CR=1 FL=1